jgi:hypothetical protein
MARRIAMRKRVDLTGKKFGLLTAVEYSHIDKKWICECECGNRSIVPSSKLTAGTTTSCGKHSKYKDITGQRFGRLLVIKPLGINKHGVYEWLCKCDCGKEIIVIGTSLRSGNTRSCGCYKPNFRHGKHDTRLHHIWGGMKQRCNDKNCKSYINYGGRGVSVCDEWSNDFMAFYTWALQNGYNDSLQIDRIDVNGNYEPLNCRWVTLNENKSNRRISKTITGDFYKLTVYECAALLGVSWSKIYVQLGGKTDMSIYDLLKLNNGISYGSLLTAESE